MPYRPGISSIGEDYVGELEGLSRKLMQGKGTRFPYLYKFESEDELDQTERDIFNAEASDKAIMDQRRKYMAYWGSVRYQERLAHEDHQSLWCHPTDRHDWSCGLCTCGKGMSMFCRCGEGKKQISPNRIVFWNSHVAYMYRNLVYVVGEGIYVPKKNREPAPDWRELSWAV